MAQISGVSVRCIRAIEAGESFDILVRRTLLPISKALLASPDKLLGFDRDEGMIAHVASNRLEPYAPERIGAHGFKCPQCDTILLPGVLHSRADCVRSIYFDRERSLRSIAQQFGLQDADIEEILRPGGD